MYWCNTHFIAIFVIVRVQTTYPCLCDGAEETPVYVGGSHKRTDGRRHRNSGRRTIHINVFFFVRSPNSDHWLSQLQWFKRHLVAFVCFFGYAILSGGNGVFSLDVFCR